MKIYHVVRNRDVHEGDKIEAGSGYNFFAQRLFGKDFSVEEKDINEILLTKTIEDLSAAEKNMLKSYVYESCAIVRELVLENYRLKNCPDLPSRLKCLFCCKTFQQAQKWVPILKRMNKSGSVKIVELEADGQIFEADGNLMLRNTLSVFDKENIAENYWKNKMPIVERELLFVGEAKVLKVFDTN